MTTRTEEAHAPLGVAVAKRTGERRLLTREQYLALDHRSEARWEFFGLRVDPASGTPDPQQLRKFGLTPGGPTVILGDVEEIEPGFFRQHRA